MDHVDKLQRIFEASGLTQEALANRLGVSFATVNAWVNGRSRPRAKALATIDETYAELVGGALLDARELAGLIENAESFQITTGEITQDRELLDRLTLTLTYNTGAIEGSNMTIADTEVVLFEGTAVSNRTLIEQLEAKNHQAALWWLLDAMQGPASEVDDDLILSLHTRLMNGIISNAGRYRQHAVRIAGTRVTVANYLRVPELIAEICSERKHKNQSIIEFLAEHHARFERIHPFTVGNGRVGRLLFLALALQHGIVPPIIERERRGLYYKALERAQVDEDYVLLQQLIAGSVVSSSRVVFATD